MSKIPLKVKRDKVHSHPEEKVVEKVVTQGQLETEEITRITTTVPKSVKRKLKIWSLEKERPVSEFVLKAILEKMENDGI